MALPVTREEPKGTGPAEAVAVLAALVGLDLLATTLIPRPPDRVTGLWSIGGVRLLELVLLGAYGWVRGWSLARYGLVGPRAWRGVRVGVLFCAGTGAAVLVAEAGFRLTFQGSFLSLVSVPLPAPGEWLPLIVVGALIAPLFEELVFRGLLYAGLRRRLPPTAAVLAVTALFAVAHLPTTGVPWVQAIGGLLFCAAYELSASLWAPLLVHAVGNLALFLLPLLF